MMLVLRFAVLSLAASVGWFVGMTLAFGPAQAILANPDHQSAKFLSIFSTVAPPPRIDTPQEYAGLLLVLGAFIALAWRIHRPDADASAWRRGLRFGVLAWLIMVPWFELYLPWNALHEPMPLVLLEAVCWWVTLTCSALAMAFVDRTRNSQPTRVLSDRSFGPSEVGSS